MKYVIIIPDGCADEPQIDLNNLTPLQAASTPFMDQIARRGIVGSANHTPLHLTAGSAVANMSLLGYDPDKNFTGRAPLEAAAQGIELAPNDWAIRCNLVTVIEQEMKSFTAGHISSEEAKALLEVAQQNNEMPHFEFVPGVSYRNLLLYRGPEDSAAPFSRETRSTPPHDLTDQSIENDFPRGPGSNLLTQMMTKSVSWFENHEINTQRKASGKSPATNVWLWGLGKQPSLESYESRHGLKGAMITAVDLLRGLASLIGWQRIEVPGATGYTDTDYAAKGAYGIRCLSDYDIVCVHVEASDEASHEGDTKKKVEALERIDADIVGPILNHLDEQGEPFRILVTPDHPTFIRTKTHTHGDVPFVICGHEIQPDSFVSYDEENAAKSDISFDQGFELMPEFVRGFK
ncbi:MAG: cofactor-independent phosphoglycerate mutase [Planctomycetota bacterium]